MCSVCPPCCCTTQASFRSVRWCTILLQSPSVLTTLGSDIRQQSFTKNTFTVIRAAYFCSQFNENNASFADTRDANRNHYVMHVTRVGNSNTKRVSLFWHILYVDTSVETKAKVILQGYESNHTEAETNCLRSYDMRMIFI